MVVRLSGVKFHRRTHSITLLQKPICTPTDYSKTYGTFMTLAMIDESGQERPMTDNELKAQAEKLKELTHKIQAYLESARRSVMSQFPRIDRSVVEIK